LESRAIYIFLLVFFFTGRLYIFAPTYYEVKIFHSIGMWINNLMLVSYIIWTSRGKAKLSWCLFFVYSAIAFLTYLFNQMTMDHELAAYMWGNGIKDSAPNQIFGKIGFIQDIFVPIFAIAAFYLLERRIDGRPRQDNGRD
jgi:hypothetical protein